MVKKRAPGRPKKAAGERRDADIRIPVTATEKQAIQAAVGNGELAAWARATLLAAAKKLVK